MAGAFDRMLFLTATPFQLGHHEFVHILERFADVRWDPTQFGERETFFARLRDARKMSRRQPACRGGSAAPLEPTAP